MKSCKLKPAVYIKKIPFWHGINPHSKAQSCYAAEFRDKIARHLYNINDLQLDYGSRGKPFYVNSKLCFNISHSRRMVCAAFYNKPVGIDIEYIRPREMMDQLASHFFHNDELYKFRSLEKEKKVEFFYRIWTRKECYIKFTGAGLGESLKDFSTERKIEHKGEEVNIVSYVKGVYYISYAYQN